MLEFTPSRLFGCFEIQPLIRRDHRGIFSKSFHEGQFRANGLATDFAEVFYSNSVKGVVRGMHFQLPPNDHDKLVYCVHGEIFDVALDLRRGSPTYAQHESYLVSSCKANEIYLPAGFAHGFQALSDEAIVIYHVTKVHSPEHDAGIRWDSAGIEWPITSSIVSQRDSSHILLSEFDSPFRFSDGIRPVAR